MFQFTRCPPHGLCVQPWVSRHDSGRVAPFGFSGFFACMQLPLNVSPVSASFFGFKRLGIHLVLIFPFVYACVLFLCFNSCCAARYSKIEGTSFSVVNVLKVQFSGLKTPTSGEWKPVWSWFASFYDGFGSCFLTSVARRDRPGSRTRMIVFFAP